MARLEASVTINRPVEEVFAFTTEEGNSTQWHAQVMESAKTSEGPVGVGTTGHEVRQFAGYRFEVTGEITDWEPNRRSSIKITSGPVTGHSTWQFESVDGGTRFTVVHEVQIDGLLRLASPAISRMAQRQLETDMANLKDILESRS